MLPLWFSFNEVYINLIYIVLWLCRMGCNHHQWWLKHVIRMTIVKVIMYIIWSSYCVIIWVQYDRLVHGYFVKSQYHHDIRHNDMRFVQLVQVICIHNYSYQNWLCCSLCKYIIWGVINIICSNIQRVVTSGSVPGSNIRTAYDGIRVCVSEAHKYGW